MNRRTNKNIPHLNGRNLMERTRASLLKIIYMDRLLDNDVCLIETCCSIR